MNQIAEKPAVPAPDALGVAKVTLGFMADVLYLKGVICIEEFDAIMEAKTFNDIEDIVEKMCSKGFNVFKRGEHRIVRGD